MIEDDLGVMVEMEDDLEIMEDDLGMMEDDIAVIEDDLEKFSWKFSSPMDEEWIKTIYMTEINRRVSEQPWPHSGPCFVTNKYFLKIFAE